MTLFFNMAQICFAHLSSLASLLLVTLPHPHREAAILGPARLRQP